MTMKYRFSSQVLHARLARKLTQEQAAEFFNISVRWYQLIEKGQYLPAAELALRIMAEFEIDGKNLKEGKGFPKANVVSFGVSEGA